MPECFICSRKDVPLKKKRFGVLYYIVNEFICQLCFSLPTCEFTEGEW